MLNGGSVSYLIVPYFNDANVILDGGNIFRPQPVNTETIILTKKGLNGFNDTNSVGSDDIPSRFIEDSLYFTAFYLTCVINTSTVTDVFPTS